MTKNLSWHSQFAPSTTGNRQSGRPELLSALQAMLAPASHSRGRGVMVMHGPSPSFETPDRPHSRCHQEAMWQGTHCRPKRSLNLRMHESEVQRVQRELSRSTVTVKMLKEVVCDPSVFKAPECFPRVESIDSMAALGWRSDCGSSLSLQDLGSSSPRVCETPPSAPQAFEMHNSACRPPPSPRVTRPSRSHPTRAHAHVHFLSFSWVFV